MLGIDWTGVEVDCLQKAMLRGDDGFADQVGCSARAVRQWVAKGLRTNLQPGTKRLLEETYKCLSDAERQRFERGLADAGRLPTSTVTAVYQPQPMAFLPHLDGQPTAGGVLPVLDAVRGVVDQTLSTCSVTTDRLDVIEERAADHMSRYTTAPPEKALTSLAQDLVDVQGIAVRRQPGAIQSRLSEVTALLSLLVADSMMKLGEIDRAKYWFGSARLAADDTPNLRLRARVRAQHAMLPYYYGPISRALQLAREAQRLLPGIGYDETALAAAAEARALARTGDTNGAGDAMRRAQRLTDALDDTTSDEAFRFGGRRLLLYLSGTLTYMGEIDRAQRVQAEALDLYRQSPDILIDPALIELDAAVGHAMKGAIDDGCQLATRVLSELPPDHRTDIVLKRAADVVAVIPSGHRELPAVRALKELVPHESNESD